LKLPELKAICDRVISASEKYQPVHAIAFQVMRHTGCREGEVVDLTRWWLNSIGEYELQPQKKGTIRTIQAIALPVEFRLWIAANTTGRSPTSTDRLRSAFRQMAPTAQLTVGHKGISTHLFRYTYMRDLQARGYTPAQIQTEMGITSSRVVSGYLNAEIYG
jgi:integrase